MTLVIEKGTPLGDAKIEAIEWAEEQFNNVLKQVFTRYTIIKGLTVIFDLPDGNEEGQSIRVNVSKDEPKTPGEMKKAIETILPNEGQSISIAGEIIENKNDQKKQ